MTDFGPQKQPASPGRINATWRSVLKRMQEINLKADPCKHCKKVACTIKLKQGDGRSIVVCKNCLKEVGEKDER